ncbi:PREDICTED: lamin tail domain-containing protein 1 isoform X2 [Chinchilla lanigera]|uniref:lamin tail domain-containing protein 1 isoform X2 n=1 Tax=Chinchilla lanigera TaxID=34839 RepID=UPI0006989F1C|nr:PREDICTED: lamin tail domain-containing protein 1 isoform X2 [Chinchilla lanigera]
MRWCGPDVKVIVTKVTLLVTESSPPCFQRLLHTFTALSLMSSANISTGCVSSYVSTGEFCFSHYCGKENIQSEGKETSGLGKMKDTEEIQEASESLQGEALKQENKMETQEQKEDKLRTSLMRHQSSVYFFSKKTDSHTTTLPMTQSLSSRMSPNWYLSSHQISKVTVSTVAPSTSKSTVMSSSQIDSSLENSCLLLSKNLDPESPVAGDGEDYFLSLFDDSKKLTSHSSHAKEPHKHFSTILEEVGKSISSSLGDIEIAEVNVKGLFVKLINSSLDKEVEIGNHILQQNVKGQAVSLYRFPSNVIVQAGSTVTVWAVASKGKHQPPFDFLWKEQSTFQTSPDCTTILCKPNGEAVAWYTPIHWRQLWEKLDTDIEFNRSSVAAPTSPKHTFLWTSTNTLNKEKQEQPREDTSKRDPKQVQFLQREKEMPPALFPNRSPWCHTPYVPAHPYSSLIEPYDGCAATGSSSDRHPRSQSARAHPASDWNQSPRDTEGPLQQGVRKATTFATSPLRVEVTGQLDSYASLLYLPWTKKNENI